MRRPANAFHYSVVVPCHNAARTLKTTLEHLDRLTPRPREVLVIDDGSTDDSSDVAGRHPGVTVLRSTTRDGPSRARNAGAQRASGDFLLFVDSDCYVSAAGFAKATALLGDGPHVTGVMGVFSRETANGPFAGIYKNYFRHLEIRGMRNPPPVFNSSCFLIRRDAYWAVGGFDERFGAVPTEDNEFYFRLVQRRFVLFYLADFSFVHDKPMTVTQLFREDARRASAIVLNLRGRLGQPGRTWSRRERMLWAFEVAAGNVVAAGPAALVIWLAGARGGPALALLWVVAAIAFAGVLSDKLRFALRDRGPLFAGRLYGYRVLEMVAAAVGCARVLLSRRREGYNQQPA